MDSGILQGEQPVPVLAAIPPERQNEAAPEIGDGCLIGAGAVIVGGVKIGDCVKIGAGAVVSFDVPDGCTVVAQPPRVISREARL